MPVDPERTDWMVEQSKADAEAEELAALSRSRRSSQRRPLLAPALLAVLGVALLASGASLEFGWIGGPTTGGVGGCPQAQTVNGAGSTFVAPLMDAWETDYQGAALNYLAVGSGTGVEDLQALAVDFAASDAPLTPFQVSQFSHTVLTMPEAAGAVAIIYNLPGLSAPINVNGTWLADVFTGSITNWDGPMLQELNPGVTLPNLPIVVVHRSDGSGTSYVFQQYLSLDNVAWSQQYNYSTTWLGPSSIPGEVAAKGSAGVSAAVLATKGAISYVDLTYALTNGVPVAAVENPSGKFIVPSLDDTVSAISDMLARPWFKLPTGEGNWSGVNMLNAAGAGDYPLSTFTYVMFYEAPDVAWLGHVPESTIELLLNFLDWAIHEGQDYSSGLFYAPLPSSVVASDVPTLSLVTWGGSPVGVCG